MVSTTLALLTVVSAITKLLAGLASKKTVAGRAAYVLGLPVFIAAWYFTGASVLTGIIAFVAGGLVWGAVRYILTGN